MSEEVAQFARAIRNIQTFTESNEEGEYPLISDLEVEGMEIILPKRPRMMELANFIFSLTMNENSPQKDVLNAFKESTEIIGKHSNLLVEFENGSSEQKDFAERANKIITRFNELIDRAKTPPKGLSQRIARKMFELCGLFSVKDLNKIPPPQKYLIKVPLFHSAAPSLGDRKVTSDDDSDTSKKISTLTSHVKTELSRETLDMYRLKAILLLEKKGLCSRLDARTVVMNSPIETKYHDETCEIVQEFSTLSGPLCQIHCIFSRDKPSEDYRQFVSIQISLESPTETT